VKILDRGNLWPGGQPAIHVEYESGEQRPVRHVRPRRHDCTAEIGTAASFDEARTFIGKRCGECHRRIYRVKFPVTATVLA